MANKLKITYVRRKVRKMFARIKPINLIQCVVSIGNSATWIYVDLRVDIPPRETFRCEKYTQNRAIQFAFFFTTLEMIIIIKLWFLIGVIRVHYGLPLYFLKYLNFYFKWIEINLCVCVCMCSRRLNWHSGIENWKCSLRKKPRTGLVYVDQYDKVSRFAFWLSLPLFHIRKRHAKFKSFRFNSKVAA